VEVDGKKVDFAKTPEAQLKALNSKCNTIGGEDDKMASPTKIATGDYKSMTTTCDKTAMKTKLYKDAECKQDEGAVETSLKWGECKTLTDGDKKVYYKLNVATALQATAAIALAYVGAQF